MKKFVSLTLGAIFLLTACSDSKETISRSEKTTDSQVTEQIEKVEEVNAQLEIVHSGSSVWSDSINSIWVNSAAIYENTGDVPVEIGETQMNYKSKDGSILGTSSMIYAVPSVVQPGETAIITEGTILDGETTINNYAETTYNFNFQKTDKESNLMEVSAVKSIDGEYDYSVTGIVKNPTSEQQDDIRIAAILYDANGNILGGLSGSVDVGLAPGSEAGFELNYPSLPDDIGSKIKKIDVKSYGFTW